MAHKEVLRHQNESIYPPTAYQMLQLQKIGITIAKGQSKLKENSRQSNSHFFIPKGVQKTEIVDEQDGFRYSRHAFTGRVARVGYKQWRMHIAEDFKVHDGETGQDDGFRNTFKFEWSHRGVHMARKLIHACELPSDQQDTDENMILILAEPDFIGATRNLETVSRGDCKQLMQDMRNFGVASSATFAGNTLTAPGLEV